MVHSVIQPTPPTSADPLPERKLSAKWFVVESHRMNPAKTICDSLREARVLAKEMARTFLGRGEGERGCGYAAVTILAPVEAHFPDGSVLRAEEV